MIVGIHQPNFFPWLGYFKKIACSERFVFLDKVQLPKKGGSWVNRVRILQNGEPTWMTSPVCRGSGTQLIDEVTFNSEPIWREKCLKTLRQNYSKCSFFDEVFPDISKLFQNGGKLLSEFNIQAIQQLSSRLGLTTEFILQSELTSEKVFKSKGSERLAAICCEIGADEYLAGDGAAGYEDLDVYTNNSIKLKTLEFEEPYYSQGQTDQFLPGLSILVPLFQKGYHNTRMLLEGNS